MQSLAPVVVDEHVRAGLKLFLRREEREQEIAAGVSPGPRSIRLPCRFGVLEVTRGSRVGVRLHPEFLPPDPYPLVVPQIACLHQRSEQPYESDEVYFGYSGPATEVFLLEVVGRHAIGFVVDGVQERALRVGDEAWGLPW